MAPLVLVLVLGAAVQAAEFKAVCDLQGAHPRPPARADGRPPKPNALRDDPQVELRILREAVALVYPRLPPDLQRVAAQLTFMIDHRHERMGELYSGWSAEDDPDYRYPDRGFYPQGTIKVNVAPRVIEYFHMAYFEEPDASRDGSVPPRQWTLAQDPWWPGFLAHELRHAQQYVQRPLRDLRESGACPEGLCDEIILEETRQKVDYEREAYETEATLNPNTKWEDYRARYELQYVPAQIVRRLAELRSPEELSELKSRWERAWQANSSCGDRRLGQACADVRETYPYLKDVEARYARELARLEAR